MGGGHGPWEGFLLRRILEEAPWSRCQGAIQLPAHLHSDKSNPPPPKVMNTVEPLSALVPK